MQGSDNEDEDDEDAGKGDDDEEKQKERKKKEQVAQWIQSVAAFNASNTDDGSLRAPPSPAGRPQSRSKPTLISIDEDGVEKMLDGGSFVSGPYVPRTGRGGGPGYDDNGNDDEENDEVSPEGRPEANPDWERQVADMPDEAAEIEAQQEAKSSKSGRKPDEASKPGDDGQSEMSAGDGGTEIDGQSVASGCSAHDEILVDFRRGRLLKKLILLIRGPSLMVPLNKFTKHSLLNILAIVVVHIIFFAIFMSQSTTRAGQLYTIFRHGQAIDRSQIVYYRALRTEHCLKLAAGGATMPETNICAKADNDPDFVMDDLQDAVEDYSTFHQDVFLGANGEVEKIIDPTARSLWNDDAMKVRLYYDTDPPSEREVEKGLWEVGNRLAYAGRELQVAYSQEPTSIGDSRAFYFVRENTPRAIFQNYVHSIDLISRFIHDDQGELSNAIIAFLIVESVVVLTLLHLYQLHLTVFVERARLGGMLAMVGLPIPVLKLMHKKPLMILEDDSDEEQEEEEGELGKRPRNKSEEEEDHAVAVKAAKDAARKSFAAEDDSKKLLAQGPTSHLGGSAAGSEAGDMVTYMPSSEVTSLTDKHRDHKNPFKLPKKLQYNSKSLFTSWGKIFKLMLPFFLWQLAVAIVWAVTVAMVEDVKGPIVSLALSMRVVYRFSHVRATAIALIVQDTDKGKDQWKEQLSTQVDHLASEYDALLYGGIPTSLEGTVFELEAPAIAFESQQFKSNFFQEKKCFRADKSKCLQPGHPFYEASQNGLDAMMRRMISELRLLVADNNSDVNYLNQRVDFLHQIGSNDITDGLQSTAELFTSHTSAKYDEVQSLQIALLVITLALAAMYIYFALWPYEKEVKREASHVAGLLSHTPAEMDIRRHLQGALKKACPWV